MCAPLEHGELIAHGVALREVPGDKLSGLDAIDDLGGVLVEDGGDRLREGGGHGVVVALVASWRHQTQTPTHTRQLLLLQPMACDVAMGAPRSEGRREGGRYW